MMSLDRFSQPLEQEFYMMDDLSFVNVETECEDETCVECNIGEQLPNEDVCEGCAEGMSQSEVDAFIEKFKHAANE